MSIHKFLGQEQTHYYTQGDNQGRCPQCFKTNTVQGIGSLSVNGTDHDVQNCTSCNRIFTGANGGIQSLINEAQQQYNTQNVGFSGNHTINVSSESSNQPYYPPDNGYKFDQMNNNLLILQNQMSNLVCEIIRIANQNQELLTKLATDPLINIRKRVSDFNLE